MADERVPALGTLQVPDDWDTELEVLLRARPKQPMPQLAARAGTVKDPPAPTLIVQRRRGGSDAASWLQTFLERTAQTTRGMSAAPDAELSFDDGARARAMRVTLDTAPPVVQVHVARVDGGVVTHFVAATAAGDDGGMAALLAVLRSWRPPPA